MARRDADIVAQNHGWISERIGYLAMTLANTVDCLD